ncbi:MAG: TIM-barrel domain-containing protein [Spirosomataceae bacterium]
MKPFKTWWTVSVVAFLLLNYSGFSQNAGDFVSYSKNTTHLRIKGTKADLLIQSYASGIFRVQLVATNGASSDSSYCVVLKPQTFVNQVIEQTNTIEILSDKCSLEITKKPLSIALKTAKGIKIKEDGGLRMSRDSLYISFKINPEDVFHGSGGRVADVNLARRGVDFYNTHRPGYYEDTYGFTTGLTQNVNVPFVVSSHKFGLFFDSNQPNSMRLFLGASDSTKIEAEVLNTARWSYYLINGESNDEILQNYTLLTGRQPLPPRWALGYIQSKYGYRSETEVKDVVNRLQSQGFPLDVMILNRYWYGADSTIGNLDWAKDRFPNPTQMMKDLAAKGVKTVLTNDSFMSEKSFNFKLADSLGYLTKDMATNRTGRFQWFEGNYALIDIFKPQTRNWLGKIYENLINQGVNGWVDDKIEPQEHPDSYVHPNGTASQVHNLYSLVWAKNVFENSRRVSPDKRVFNMVRSAWAGSQRYGALPWSGNPMRFWSSMKLQVPMMLHAGFSGLAYMHADIGGFNTAEREKDEELDMRWYQFATFSPIMKMNGNRSNTEPYFLNQPFIDIVKRYIRIRYELLPYTYTLAYQNSRMGRPICMSMDYFDLSTTNANINDQYFFGENLVVAPIFLYGMLVRKVVLPKGKWFNFWTNRLYDGDKNIFENVNVNNIPVFAKAGSLVPMARSAKTSTDLYTSDSLKVKFFQDISVAKGSFTMFHDDGKDPNSLTNQRFELLEFTGNTTRDTLRFEAKRTKTFDAGLANRSMTVEFINLTSLPKSVLVDNQTVPIVLRLEEFNKDNVAFYDLNNKVLSVRYSWNCNNTSRVTVIREGLLIVTSTEDEVQNSLQIYPNPSRANSDIEIRAITTKIADYTLEIISTTGATIYEHKFGRLTKDEELNHKWNPKNLSGVFVVRLKNDLGQIISKKIVIE